MLYVYRFCNDAASSIVTAKKTAKQPLWHIIGALRHNKTQDCVITSPPHLGTACVPYSLTAPPRAEYRITPRPENIISITHHAIPASRSKDHYQYY